MKPILLVLVFRTFDVAFPYLLSKSGENFNRDVYLSIFHWPLDSVINTESYYKTFDSQHYLYLAEKWYSKNPIQQNAFFPLYPFIIRLFKFFTGSYFWSAILVSNLLSILGFYFLCLYLDGEESQTIGVFLLILTFPASFFLSRIYTEPLFFLLLVLLMYGIKKDMKRMTFFASLLLPLTRPQGVVTGLAIFIMFIFFREKRKLLRYSIAGFLGGGLLYVVVMYFSTGDILASIHAQSLYPRANPVKMLVSPYRWLKENFFYPSFALHYLGPGNFVYERIIFIIFIMAIIAGLNYLRKEEYLLLVVVGMFSALTDHFMSFSRFILPLFPLYIALWEMLKSRRLLYTLLVLLFLITHVLLLSLHSMSYFVG